jgi:hypothetical protein
LGLRNWEAGRGGVGCGLVSEPEVVQQRDGEGGVEVEVVQQRDGDGGVEVEVAVLPSEVEQRVGSDESAEPGARELPEKETFEDEDEDEDAVLVEREETQALTSPEGESRSSEKRNAEPHTMDDVGGGRDENTTRAEMASGLASSQGRVVVHVDVSDMADQYPFWS